MKKRMNTIKVLSTLPTNTEFPYRKYYEMAKVGHFWIDWRFTVFLMQLRSLGIHREVPLKGLDAGCGNGVVRQQIEKYTQWTVDGTDLNKEALLLNKTKRGQTFLYDLHDRHLNLKEAYDFIILFDVIEHIKETTVFLEAVRYHLKSGGWLFINVPALNSLYSSYDRAQNHFRRYNKKMLQQELARNAIEMRDIRYWGESLIPFVILRKLLLGRKLSNQAILEKGFNPPKTCMNDWLVKIMHFETSLIKKPVLGTSLMMAGIK
jgi:SAM-dependent methyltransferase